MFLLSTAMEDISLGTAGLAALLGYAVVFTGLILLMTVVVALGKAMKKARKEKAASPKKEEAAAAAAPAGRPAPGSAGQVKLFDVPDREAAMLMAIVAEKMGRPLNELRFLSIKEVK